MRAFRCDVCGEVYLLPEFKDEDPFEEMSVIPMEIWVHDGSKRPASNREADVCKTCADKIWKFIETIGRESEKNGASEEKRNA